MSFLQFPFTTNGSAPRQTANAGTTASPRSTEIIMSRSQQSQLPQMGRSGFTQANYNYMPSREQLHPPFANYVGQMANHASQNSRSQRGHALASTNPAPSVRPQFRTKVVCEINCRHCHAKVCKRGMKAILLADTNVELYSTDSPPFGIQLVLEDYVTRNCQCRIRDAACLGW